jgi:hypothetical protein
MRARIAARLIALVLTGALLSGVYAFIVASHGRLGKEAYLRSEAHSFDRYYAHPDAAFRVRMLVAGILLSGAIVGLYELLAFGSYKIICLAQSTGDAHQQT